MRRRERRAFFGLSEPPESSRWVTRSSALFVVIGLFTAPLSTASETTLRNLKLSADGLPTSDVSAPLQDPIFGWADFQVSADGEWVVYRHDDRVDEVFELYAVRRDGSERVRLSPELSPGDSIDGVWITPDGQSVVSTRWVAKLGKRLLVRVPITGPSSAEEILFDSPAGWSIGRGSLRLAGDSRTAVFKSQPSVGGSTGEIVVVRFGESRSTLNVIYPTVEWPATPTGHFLSPDSQWVLVRAGALLSKRLDDDCGLWVRLDEGEASGPMAVEIVYFSPDSQRVILLKSLTGHWWEREAFSVPIGGPGAMAVRMNPLLGNQGRVHFAYSTPDSSRVMMNMRLSGEIRSRLFTVPIEGPADAAVEVSLPPTGLYGASLPLPTPDSQFLYYTMDSTGALDPFAYRVPMEGPPESTVTVTPPVGPGARLGFYPAPSGEELVYSVHRSQMGGSIGFHVMASASAPDGGVMVAESFADEYQLTWLLFDPTMKWVAMVAPFEAPLKYEIFRASLENLGSPAERVSLDLPPGSFVRNEMVWTPDGYGLVYRADGETVDKIELYIADALVFRDGFESGGSGRWR